MGAEMLPLFCSERRRLGNTIGCLLDSCILFIFPRFVHFSFFIQCRMELYFILFLVLEFYLYAFLSFSVNPFNDKTEIV